MKVYFVCLIFLACLSIGFPAATIGDYSDPNHPGKCVMRNLILSPGTHYPAGSCARILCYEGGHAETHTCGVLYAGPGCKMGDYIEPDANYPACCLRKIVCD